MRFTLDDPRGQEVARRIHALSDDLKLVAQLKAPTVDDFIGAPVLYDWSLCQRLEPALSGRVAGHPSIPEGQVVTSGLYLLDPVLGYARTLSRWYRLMEPAAQVRQRPVAPLQEKLAH